MSSYSKKYYNRLSICSFFVEPEANPRKRPEKQIFISEDDHPDTNTEGQVNETKRAVVPNEKYIG